MRPSLVVISRRGRASVDPRCWDELERRARVTVVRRNDAPTHDEAVRLLAGADVVGATNLCLPTVDAALLDELPRLRGIVLYATGYDHLDVPLLRSRQVGLSVLPEYATAAVAEHALAMLLALATRLHLAHDRGRGASPPDASLRGIELAGKTLGIIGVGRIGGRLARLARGIGMRVAGTDIDPRVQVRAEAAGVAMGPLDRVLERSHAVAVCASHTHGAPPILGRPELASLRPGALLVNVARAALVDTAEAVAAVRAGRLRGYAVDDTVLDPVRDRDLLQEGRVLQTGHSAWWRDEVLDRGARMWGERLVAAVSGHPLDAVTWPAPDRVFSLSVPTLSRASR
jgi:phosphoglycerate dehydrogenase-like enzyme